MLERIVRYLTSHGVPFRLSSQPSPEPLPEVAHRPPPGGLVVQTHVVLVSGRPAVACSPRGAGLGLARLARELGTPVVEGTPGDLPPPWGAGAGPVPPLGGAMGVPCIVDEAVATASSIVFPVFAAMDVVEIPYDDFARLEQPRVASFAQGGELPGAPTPPPSGERGKPGPEVAEAELEEDERKRGAA